MPLPQVPAPTWPYYNNPYPDYTHHTRRNSTPPYYPNSDNSEVTVGKAKVRVIKILSFVTGAAKGKKKLEASYVIYHFFI